MTFYLASKDCNICIIKKSHKALHKMVKSKLKLSKNIHQHHNQSIANYYKGQINQYMQRSANSLVINLKYDLFFKERNEFLKKMQNPEKTPKKLKKLVQFYKYTIEVPRIFMKSVLETVQSNSLKIVYNYKKRQILYNRIRRSLNPDTVIHE